MCGIVGYVGPQQAAPILLAGLSRLEYRGYDSAGVAVSDGAYLRIMRRPGKLAALVDAVVRDPLPGSLGIGHTRWATHGRPSEQNAHPHRSGRVVVVHNGIIENHLELRRELEGRGYVFQSETDTEILSHLIEDEMRRRNDFVGAVRAALGRVHGSYAIAVLNAEDPDRLVVARFASPLVLGLGDGENFVASDIPAVLSYTRDFVFLDDGDMAEVTRAGVRIQRADTGEPVERPVKAITWSASAAEKAGYKHFMLKEIHEQPRAVTDTLRGRLSPETGRVILDDVKLDAAALAGIRRILMLACGTSYHAALTGKFWIEEFSGIPTEVDLASEFRYRESVVDDSVLIIAVSQSGETADTLAAIKDAKRRGARILSICNVVDSSIPRASHDVLYTHAGPEIGVASTKAFTTQLTALYLIGLHLGTVTGRLGDARLNTLVDALLKLPGHIEEVLKSAPKVHAVAERFHKASDYLFLGRWVNYPIALEGALKLKEISYIHAEGYAAGEMKHGPIALIDENLPVVVVAPKDRVFDKTRSNLQEVRARKGIVIAVVTAGTDVGNEAAEVIELPEIEETLTPLLTVVPLQLLAYATADIKGTDVDQPRNLAKSVTVE